MLNKMTFFERLTTGTTGMMSLLLTVLHVAVLFTWFESATSVQFNELDGLMCLQYYIGSLLLLGFFVLYQWNKHTGKLTEVIAEGTETIRQEIRKHYRFAQDTTPWWWRFFNRKRGKFKGYMRTC